MCLQVENLLDCQVFSFCFRPIQVFFVRLYDHKAVKESHYFVFVLNYHCLITSLLPAGDTQLQTFKLTGQGHLQKRRRPGSPQEEETHQLSRVLTFPCRALRSAGSLSCCAPSTDSAPLGIWSSAASTPRATKTNKEYRNSQKWKRKNIYMYSKERRSQDPVI